MSLVLTVITQDFAIMSADTRATNENTNTIVDIANKLIRVNNNIVFGCTGKILDNLQLFEGFCKCDKNEGFYKTIRTSINFKNFIAVITDKFMEMKAIHEDINNEIAYNLCSIVCGYDDADFKIVIFTLKKDEADISHINLSSNETYRLSGSGNDTAHFYNINKMIKSTMPSTIEQYLELFDITYKVGATRDRTINDKVHYEIIKREV